MCKPKDVIVAFIGAVTGLTIVEFTLGWWLMNFFKANNPVSDPATGIVQLFGYIIGAAIIFGFVFTFMADSMKIRRKWLSGLKLGGFIGIIAMLPWAVMAYFLTTLDFTYVLVSTIYGLIEFGLSGLLAMLLLAKFGIHKR